MKRKYIFTTLTAALILSSCSDKNDVPDGNDQTKADRYELSGKVEKGPFVRGSSISVQPLNASLNAIGTVFNGDITDDAGTFNLGQIELASQFVRITTDGYYFNEVTGELSTGTLHLTALADLSDRNSVNVNIITHLKSARIQKLMMEGKTFAEADKQAQGELLCQFGLQAYENNPAESMSISAGTDGSGVLIAISSIVLSDRTDAEITQFLSRLSQDLADDGSFTEENMKTVFQSKNRVTQNLEKLSLNIIDRYSELGMYVTVPDLRYFYDWNNDGIAGNEIYDNVNVSLSQNEIAFGKDGGTATVTVTSNIPLSLDQYKDPYGDGYLDVTPGTSSSEESFFNGFFVEQGASMQCEYTFENNVLSIKVAKTEKRTRQSSSISLYDMMGVCRATVEVTLDGDPSIEVVLSETGRQVVSAAFSYLANAVSWMYYVECGYTGMDEYHSVRCPFRPDDDYNNKAYVAAYSGIARINNFIKVIENSEYSSATPLFKLLRAIIYTEMVDKWGNLGIVENASDDFLIAEQKDADDILRYIESQLDEIASEFADKKADSQFDSADKAFDISKDVWRVAKANVHINLGELSQAVTYLQEIVDSRRYSVESGSENESNNGTILQLIVPEEVVVGGHTIGYYSYADVLLMLAECNIEMSNSAKATNLIREVATAKGIALSGNNVEDIESLRRHLLMPRYFAFQKRNGIGGYADYQKLWPIPYGEIIRSGWKQNPGY